MSFFMNILLMVLLFGSKTLDFDYCYTLFFIEQNYLRIFAL